MHRSAPSAAAAFHLSEHLGHDEAGRHSPGQRVPVLAVGGEDGILGRKRRHDPGGDGLLAYIQMEESPDLPGAIEFGRFLFKSPDPEHLAIKGDRLFLFSHEAPPSRVERSPSGRPSSRALSSRLMIFPLRVRGSEGRISISLGAIAAPRRFRAWPRSSSRRSSEGAKPDLSDTKAFTTSIATGSGFPIAAASATAGCSISALSTSNG